MKEHLSETLTHLQWITHWMDWSHACCSSTRVCTSHWDAQTKSSHGDLLLLLLFFLYNVCYAPLSILMYKNLPTVFHSSIPGDETSLCFSFFFPTEREGSVQFERITIADSITDTLTQSRIGKLEPGGKDRNICNNLAAKRRTHGTKEHK